MTTGQGKGIKHPFKRYTNPYLDVASMYYPKTAKELFEMGRVFYYGSSIVKPIIDKYSEYTVTDLVYQNSSSVITKHWKKILEDNLKIKSTLMQAGKTKFALGNYLMSIRFPTRRKFVCKDCLEEIWEDDAKWDFAFPTFNVYCKSCKSRTKHTAIDVTQRDVKRISFIHWNPEHIHISHSQEMPEKTKYFYKIPPSIRSKILKGYKHQISGIPAIYITAVEKQRLIEIEKDNLYHMKTQSISEDDCAWGKPLATAGFKQIRYKQTLNKSQEAIALERANPLDLIWPAQTGGHDPIASQNMEDFASSMEEQISRHRDDINYKAIMPFPVGSSRLGGDAKGLMLDNEMAAANKEIASSMDSPIEMVYGGLTWSASSVNMRMLENKFMRHREDLIDFVRWIILRLCVFVGLPPVDVDMTEFKMADDPQQKQLAIQLYGMGLLSAKTMLAQWGWEWTDEMEQRAKEEVARSQHQEKVAEIQAKIQGKTNIINATYAAEAQFTAQSKMVDSQQRSEYSRLKIKVESLMRQDGTRNPNVDDMINELSEMVENMTPDVAQRIMQNIRQQSPSVASLLEIKLSKNQPMMQPMMGQQMGGPQQGGQQMMGPPTNAPMSNPFAPIQMPPGSGMAIPIGGSPPAGPPKNA